MSFTFLAQIVIGADHALVTGPNNLLLASITAGGVLLTAVMLDDKSLRVADLDKVMGMLLRRDCEASRACIIIGAVQAFVSIPIDLRITHVTDSVVQDWLGFGLRNRRSRGSRGWTRFPLTFATEYGVNDDATRLLNFKEFVSHRMATPPVCNARSAHVVVRTI